MAVAEFHVPDNGLPGQPESPSRRGKIGEFEGGSGICAYSLVPENPSEGEKRKNAYLSRRRRRSLVVSFRPVGVFG